MLHFLRLNGVLAGVAVLLVAAILVASRFGESPAAAPMPDFRAYEAGPERKTEFFAYIRPIVDAQNRQLLEDRARLVSLQGEDEPGLLDRRWLRKLATRYKVQLADEDGEARPWSEVVDRLILRVDAVPTSLALAQAAKESGWGTSRFAREGYNLYGEWCFDPGCGIVPNSRAPGRTHEVEAFESPTESVASYLRNINTHASYRSFRQARKEQREAKGKLSGVELAEELSRYSERREAYVQEIKSLIIHNDLEALSTQANASDD